MEILWSPRARSLRMEVWGGGIRVVAPRGYPEATVNAFIDAQYGWLKARTAAWRELAPPGEGPVDPVLPPTGESRCIVFRGRRTVLTVGETGGRGAQISWNPDSGIALLLPRQWAEARRGALGGRALSRWYDGILHAEARRVVDEVGLPRGLTPSGIRFSQPRTRWGSCAGDGTIRLNRRLIGAPARVFRSVVLHELAHLKHRNHGRGFWALVSELDPGWKDARDWLKRYGVTLG
jgi:predicted metal-dependent hydrolase